MPATSSPSSLTPAEWQTVRELVARREPGYTMPGELYCNPLVYRAELERIWRRGWLFVGHTCEIPTAGDYFTFELDNDSLIVIRGDDGAVNALWNVCRHRGTLLCSEPQGRVGRLVCPYHQWAYARDGALVSCRGMHDEVDKSQLGLLKAHCRELAGMIFVSLADEPLDFDMRIEREAWGGEAGQPLTLKLNLAAAADWTGLTLYNYAQPLLGLTPATSPGTLLTLNVPIPRAGGYAFSALITHADGHTSTTNALAYYAVGVPEPNGLLLASIAGVVIGSRWRRNYAARCPLRSSSRLKASRFPRPRTATN